MFAHSWVRAPGNRRRVLSLLATLVLTGCAGFSPDGGLSGVNAITGASMQEAVALRTPEEVDAAQARMRELLRKPLSAASVVQIALLNNRDLQAAYNALGLSEAAFVQAGLPPNPTFSLSRIAGSGGFEIEGRIIASVLNLATLPARREIAEERFRQAQLRAALETLRIASEARRAFYRAVASRALAGFLDQAGESAANAAELSKRLAETGAINKLDQARNQVFAAELTAQRATARQRVVAERERLIRALGLWGADTDFKLPAQLPPLPARPRAMARIETEAVARRIDLQMARIEAELLAKSYGLANATRFVNLLDAGGVAKTTGDKTTGDNGTTTREYGLEVELQIPLFDFGAVKVRQAEESYMQAVNRLLAKVVNVRSQAREAYAGYRARYDVAWQYRREVLPLRKIISDETLLRYNAMQIDVFALLTEARQRIASTNAAIEAERDFWLADTDLAAALIAGGAAETPDIPGTEAAAEASGH